jgi:uncharacterized RDD family membrane protein YckC
MADYKEAHEIAGLRALFHFKQRITAPQYFAGLDQRLLASVLDWFFISGFYLIIAFTATLFINDSTTRLSIFLSLAAFIPVTNFIYHIVMECSDKQATWGKQILKIQVSDMEGKRIGAGKAFGRNFCKLFCVLSLFVGYLIIFFNRKAQGMHDMMAGTLVIKDRLF